MRKVAVLVVLASCFSAANKWAPYRPRTGTAGPDAIKRAMIAMTDAGEEIETHEEGLVVSKWFSGSDPDEHFRIRVTVDEAARYEVAALCQYKDPAHGGWVDCGQKMPRFILDTMAKVEAALR